MACRTINGSERSGASVQGVTIDEVPEQEGQYRPPASVSSFNIQSSGDDRMGRSYV
jgi:hypothetical protein